MAELLTKQQIHNVAERQFKKVKEEKAKVTKNMAYDILKTFFPDESPSRLHQLVKEADKDDMKELFIYYIMRKKKEQDDE
ncbi:unnamed protein product [Rotaria magnacalcarata]|uniref:Uncharacterized protein n=1 Tax=Rotaria magnacalcarata TaxID=392030 RepID=A0A815KHU0_9BILA|nr:unnamed protein product [Rotaria magnacalcarata]CAF1390021.1 unnamed protein product [Rotaria magnacalcarata]CAF2268317.1 unnamed protein product [Rotaria magnacalcarata]